MQPVNVPSLGEELSIFGWLIRRWLFSGWDEKMALQHTSLEKALEEILHR
jgi:hypothetical protein